MATLTISEAISRIDGLLDRVAEAAERIMKEEISANVKEGTGKLAGSVNTIRVDESTRSVGTDLEYAKYVNEGRGPVFPVRAKALRWESPRLSGNAVFRASAGPAEGIHFIDKTKERLESMHFDL